MSLLVTCTCTHVLRRAGGWANKKTFNSRMNLKVMRPASVTMSTFAVTNFANSFLIASSKFPTVQYRAIRRGLWAKRPTDKILVCNQLHTIGREKILTLSPPAEECLQHWWILMSPLGMTSCSMKHQATPEKQCNGEGIAALYSTTGSAFRHEASLCSWSTWSASSMCRFWN